jgi:chorismate mutase
MRIVMLVLTLIFASTGASALAQNAIDVESQKAASPQVEDQGRIQSQQAPAQTQESAPPASSSRYSFSRVDNGFLRLDNESGQVAYCNPRAVGWACQAVAIDQAALEAEIASLQKQVALLKKLDAEIVQLQDEVASLKKEIAALKGPPPPRPPADLAPPHDKGGDVTIKMPMDEEFARARDFIEKTWRHLMEMIVTMQKDMMRKG